MPENAHSDNPRLVTIGHGEKIYVKPVGGGHESIVQLYGQNDLSYLIDPFRDLRKLGLRLRISASNSLRHLADDPVRDPDPCFYQEMWWCQRLLSGLLPPEVCPESKVPIAKFHSLNRETNHGYGSWTIELREGIELVDALETDSEFYQSIGAARNKLAAKLREVYGESSFCRFSVGICSGKDQLVVRFLLNGNKRSIKLAGLPYGEFVSLAPTQIGEFPVEVEPKLAGSE